MFENICSGNMFRDGDLFDLTEPNSYLGYLGECQYTTQQNI